MTNSQILAAAKESNLHLIRCALTGKTLGAMDDETMLASIELEVYRNPFVSMESILDSLELRLWIQSTRTAPHLSLIKDKDGFKFLLAYYPKDLFALLAGRLMFDNLAMKTQGVMTSSDSFDKLQWLVKLQDSISSFDEIEFKVALDALLYLDSVHDIKKVYYSEEIKSAARKLNTSEFSFKSLTAFIKRVEKEAMLQLAQSKQRFIGNSFAASAAIASMTLEELSKYELLEADYEASRKERILKYLAQSRPNSNKSKTTVRTITKDKMAKALAPESNSKLKAPAKTGSVKKKFSRFGDLSKFNFEL